MIYTGLNYQGKTPLDYQYTFKLKNERQKVFSRVGTSGRCLGTRKGGMRMNTVDVFLSIYKYRRILRTIC
jgi:hypothetical protein